METQLYSFIYGKKNMAALSSVISTTIVVAASLIYLCSFLL
jgi:hypothetical protein